MRHQAGVAGPGPRLQEARKTSRAVGRRALRGMTTTTAYTVVPSPSATSCSLASDGLDRIGFAARTPVDPLLAPRRPRLRRGRPPAGRVLRRRAGPSTSPRPRRHPVPAPVCAAPATLPYGETTSYAALAERLGRPGSARAVGAANGANPLAIVVPCHRVVGADGTLTGYAGGLRPSGRYWRWRVTGSRPGPARCPRSPGWRTRTPGRTTARCPGPCGCWRPGRKPLAGEGDVGHRHPLGPQGADDHLGLVGRTTSSSRPWSTR